MFEPKDMIGRDELREMLSEAEVEADPEEFERILTAVQPMRTMLRSGGLGRRRAILRGAALPPGSTAPKAAGSPRSTTLRPEPPAIELPPPTLRHLVARLGAIYVAVIAGLFAMMTAGTPAMFVFGAGTLGLLWLAITGRGLGGRSAEMNKRSEAGAIIGVALLVVTGAGPLLLLAVYSIFSPAMWREGGFVTHGAQVIGLVTVYVVWSHKRAVS